jgi:Fur family ferric uptake transcriptional regulator
MQSNKPTSSAHDLIAVANGRTTPAREAVLTILLAASQALSHQEIEKIARQQGLSCDRVTLYRVLDWLVIQGLAHKVSATDRVLRYNATQQENHHHAHFHCSLCGRIFCLQEVNPAFALTLPGGYHFERAEITIQGQCPQCSDD